MKFFKKSISTSNLVILFLIIYVLYLRVPLWIDQYKMQGIELSVQQYKAITSDDKAQQVSFPSETHNSLAIFWATWCGPCKVEMSRLKKSVLEGKIPKNRIFAINSHESIEVQAQHINENKYPFIFIQDSDLEKKLNISITPTTALINKTELEHLSSGISVIGIKRAEDFLSAP